MIRQHALNSHDSGTFTTSSNNDMVGAEGSDGDISAVALNRQVCCFWYAFCNYAVIYRLKITTQSHSLFHFPYSHFLFSSHLRRPLRPLSCRVSTLRCSWTTAASTARCRNTCKPCWENASPIRCWRLWMNCSWPTVIMIWSAAQAACSLCEQVSWLVVVFLLSWRCLFQLLGDWMGIVEYLNCHFSQPQLNIYILVFYQVPTCSWPFLRWSLSRRRLMWWLWTLYWHRKWPPCADCCSLRYTLVSALLNRWILRCLFSHTRTDTHFTLWG